MNKMRFVSLHSHTTFSFGDGYGTVPEHVSRVADLGMTALAVTEHGNSSSFVALEKACRASIPPVKPIFGIEIYVGIPKEQRKTHMILLASNEVGIQNINRLVTRSWRQFYRWPTVYPSDIKEFNEGLIVLSGCADSALSCILLGGKHYGDKRMEPRPRDIQRARRGIEWYQEIFGERYYLETQRFPLLERTCVLNQTLERLSATTGARLCATADVHYPLPDQNAMQRILHAAHRGGSVESVDATWKYDILLTYPRSDEEIHQDLVHTGMSESAATQAISNTSLIAKQCNVTLPKAPRPRYIQDESDWDTWI